MWRAIEEARRHIRRKGSVLYAPVNPSDVAEGRTVEYAKYVLRSAREAMDWRLMDTAALAGALMGYEDAFEFPWYEALEFSEGQRQRIVSMLQYYFCKTGEDEEAV